MDLVKSNSTDGQLMLNETQIQLANIKTRKIERTSIGRTITINANLSVDENRSSVISSRVSGRIEKLHIKERGVSINKGQALYDLYSEALQTLQKEYLLALAQQKEFGASEVRHTDFVKATKKKLELYGVTEAQIQLLQKTGVVLPLVTYYAPVSGFTGDVLAVEGQYVSEGQAVFNIQNTETLWVEAELYPNETALVSRGDRITVRVPGVDAEEEATVTFLSPEFRNSTQISVMRAVLRNEKQKYKAGMQAQVFFTSSEKVALTMPSDAVIRDSKATHVFIQTARNTFEPRKVETGIENFNSVEISSGINEGEDVVISGAYLLYSELVLKKGGIPESHH
jgi:Cu(I)/Ag(I) efflux system membrane fusion protein